MSTTAWAFMLSVWSVILVATAYCFARLLGSDRLGPPPEESSPTA